MPDRLPLPALLSAAFVAFVIETDNAAERAVTHKTTSFGSPGGRTAVWLSSVAMWFNCLGPLTDAGGELTVAELEQAARMSTNLDGMRRWGYVTIDGVGLVPRGSGKRPHPRRSSWLALTARGATAESIWRALPGAVEERWRERFGAPAIDGLRDALVAIVSADGSPLPDFLPIGAVTEGEGTRTDAERADDRKLGLVSLLARALARFTLDYERDARVPLGAYSDLLRVLGPDTPVAVRDLPARTGIAKDWLAVITGRLEKAGCVVVEPLSGKGRGRQVRLTSPRGVRATEAARRRIDETVAQWAGPYGEGAVAALSGALEAIVGDGTRDGSPLFAGLTPPAGGWRARIDPPQRLPWYPMVTHRGGYPDGS